MVISTAVLLELAALFLKELPPIFATIAAGGEMPEEIEIDDQHVTTSAKDYLRDRTGD